MSNYSRVIITWNSPFGPHTEVYDLTQAIAKEEWVDRMRVAVTHDFTPVPTEHGLEVAGSTQDGMAGVVTLLLDLNHLDIEELCTFLLKHFPDAEARELQIFWGDEYMSRLREEPFIFPRDKDLIG